MSERKFVIIVVGIPLIISLTCMFLTGRTWGRAEMKHWQDEWYAAHPVVKEVRPPVKTTPIPPPPKPQKGKKRRIMNCWGCGEPSQPMKPNLSQPIGDIDLRGATCVAGSSDGQKEPPCKGLLIDGKCWTVAVTEEYLDLSGDTGKISTRKLPPGVLYQDENGECPKGYIPNNWASTTFVYAYCYPRVGLPAEPKP